MKILITGSSGFVGKHLVERFRPVHEIVRYDIKDGFNILNEKLLFKKLHDVDVVIHLAALISAEESWSKPKEYFINNSLGTLSVVRNAIKANVSKVIFFSSAAVKAKPLTPYAISKKAGEDFVKLYSKDIEAVIVRPENIYGLGQKASYGYVIHNFIKCLKDDRKVRIYGTGLQKRDFVYIEDVVSVVEKLLNKHISGKTISIGTGKGTKIIDLANLVARIMTKRLSIDFEPARNEPRESIGNTKALGDLGIDAKDFTYLKDGVQKLINLEYLTRDRRSTSEKPSKRHHFD